MYKQVLLRETPPLTPQPPPHPYPHTQPFLTNMD